MSTRGRPKYRELIYCDCRQEKMAEIIDGKLIIADRRHGRQHVAIVDVTRKGRKRRRRRHGEAN